MFDILVKGCEENETHTQHYWRPWWGLRKRRCRGVKPIYTWDDWRRANPSLGQRVSDGAMRKMIYPVREHRHYYLLKDTLVTPQGVPVSRENVHWQCADPFCLDIVSMPREHVREHLLRKPVDQTWPE